MVRIQILLLVFVFSSFLLSAQKTWLVSGKVTDESGSPIQRCLISIGDSLTAEYFYTGDDGHFERKTTAEKIYIQARYLGYTPFKKWLFAEDTLLLQIVLKPSAVVKEVVVSERRLPIEQVNDTLTYNLSYFRDSTERTVEDILRKLPGVTVDAKGAISVGGKPISKVLIEDDDLFGRKYVIGTKNIRADFIESVDVFKHYQENVVLKSVKPSDDIVLNLRLKKDKKNILAGGVIGGVGAGNEIKATLTCNLFLIKKRNKSILLTDNGNTGTQFGSDELGSTFETNDWLESSLNIDQKFVFPQRLQSLGMPNKYFDNGRSQFMTLRNVSRLGKNWKFTPSVYYSYKKNRQEYDFLQRYRLNSSLYNQNQHSVIDFSNLEGDISLKSSYISPNKDASCFINLNINSTKHKGLETQEYHGSSAGKLSSNLLLKKKDILLAAIYTKEVKKDKVVQLLTKVSYRHLPQEIDMFNPDFLGLFGWNDSIHLQQRIQLDNKSIDIRGKLVQKVNKHGYVEVTPYFFSEYSLLSTKFKSVLQDEVSRLNSNNIGLNILGQYRLHRLGKLLITLNNSQIIANQPKIKLGKDGSIYSLSSKYKINIKEHQFGLEARFYEKQWLREMFYSNDYFSSPLIYNDANIRYRKSKYQSFLASYRYDDSFNMFYFNVRVKWLKGTNVRAEKYGFYKNVFTQSYINAQKSSSVSTNLTISKFFLRINTNLNLNMKLRVAKTPFPLDSTVVLLTRQGVTNRVKLSILFFKRIRMILTAQLQYSFLPNYSEDKWRMYNQNIKMYYNFKGWHFGGTHYYLKAAYYNRSFENKKSSELFITKEWKTRKNKDVKWELNVVNLFDTKTYSDQFLAEQFSSSLNITAVPRYFIMSLDYGF